MIFTAILAFFQAIPAITGGITAFSQAYFNAKVKITQIKYGCDADVAKQLVSGLVEEGKTRVDFLRTVASSPFLMFLVGGFALPWMFYQAKVVAWDNIIYHWFWAGYGYTPPIEGSVGQWAGWIIGGIFGTGGVMAAGHAYFNRRER